MKERAYGLFNKVPEDKTRCIKAVHGGERWPSFHQCRRKRGYGPDGLYCKIHDPEAVKKRESESIERWEHKLKVKSDMGLIGSSTADLIAELEKRRSCTECDQKDPELCSSKCVYYHGPIRNNFKPKEAR